MDGGEERASKRSSGWSHILGTFWELRLGLSPNPDEGHYEPGVIRHPGAVPRPTALAHLVRELTHGGRRTIPSGVPGWWQRSQRLLCLGRMRWKGRIPESRIPRVGRVADAPSVEFGGSSWRFFSRLRERGLAHRCVRVRDGGDAEAIGAIIDQSSHGR